jgi:hypothetical protein
MLISELTPDTTHQQLFDYITAFLLKQNRRSVRGIECSYRGDGGSMCAVGCIVPDSVYKASWESKQISTLIANRSEESAERRAWLTQVARFSEMLEDLQNAHDHQWGVKRKALRTFDFMQKLAEVASVHGVNFNPNLWKQL